MQLSCTARLDKVGGRGHRNADGARGQAGRNLDAQARFALMTLGHLQRRAGHKSKGDDSCFEHSSFDAQAWLALMALGHLSTCEQQRRGKHRSGSSPSAVDHASHMTAGRAAHHGIADGLVEADAQTTVHNLPLQACTQSLGGRRRAADGKCGCMHARSHVQERGVCQQLWSAPPLSNRARALPVAPSAAASHLAPGPPKSIAAPQALLHKPSSNTTRPNSRPVQLPPTWRQARPKA